MNTQGLQSKPLMSRALPIGNLHIKTIALLNRLRTEKQIGTEMRDSITELLSELECQVAQPCEQVSNSAPVESPTVPLTKRFVEAGRRFEAAHPVLSRTLEEFADALSRMGI